MLSVIISADERGSAVVEFAISAGLLVLLLCAAMEFGIMFLVSSSMEAAVLAASRYGVTGYEAEGSSRQAQILAILKDRTLGLVDMDRATIETKVYQSFGDIGKPEPFNDSNGNGSYDAGESFSDVNGNGVWDSDMGGAGLGGAGDVVVYTVRYPWPALTPLMASFLDGKTLSASAAVRNEPW